MSLFLNQDELAELTGYQRRAKQMDWLRSNHYPFEIAGDGKPRVLRQALLAKLGGQAQQSPAPRLRFR